MESHDFDWSEQVKKLRSPTMLVFADADSIRPEHIVAFYKALGGGQRDAGLDGSLRSAARLGIVPGATHYNILSTTAVANMASPFLGSPGTGKAFHASWILACCQQADSLIDLFRTVDRPLGSYPRTGQCPGWRPSSQNSKDWGLFSSVDVRTFMAETVAVSKSLALHIPSDASSWTKCISAGRVVSHSYSQRTAVMGSTCAARNAGKRQAIAATRHSSRTPVGNSMGSRRLPPTHCARRGFRARVSTTPISTPLPTLTTVDAKTI